MSTLTSGDPAPAFSGVDQDGNPITLAALAGKTVVLYFYPKDNTPGCTKEACAFRDAWGEFTALGAVVIGVSADSPKSHTSFRAKFDLPFTLIADEDRAIIQAYGAWGTKKRCGREYEGILRRTVVIGPDGVVRAIFPEVKPAEHAAEILALLKEEA